MIICHHLNFPTEGEQMETNDLAAKNFETYLDVAADIINVLIYEGLQRINKDSLLASPTETVYQGRENHLQRIGCRL